MAQATEGALYALLHAQKHANSGHPTARKLLSLASTSVSSGQAEAGRSLSLRMLCEQLEQTHKHLDWLQAELERLLANDPAVKGLQQIPEFGTKTVAVLRAELGDVDRFARTDQAIAYAGLDVQIKASGLWKGQAKLSKRGSGRLATDALCGGLAQHSSGGLRLWCLLLPTGRARSQARLRLGSGDAQNAGSRCLFAHTRTAGL
jgi:transposase